MRAEEVRILWLFVFFDLPVGTKAERRVANRALAASENDVPTNRL
jgi:CRISPR/Cas system-associated protein endoribonuclease Cas2